jgi:hypothetical protein
MGAIKMPSSVEDGFAQFLRSLSTTRSESDAAKRHRASINQKLTDEFGMTSMFRTGSFGNGTNIAGFSDVDYFCIFPTANLKEDSSKTLAAVANALRQRFPFTNGIRVNGPAVKVPFGVNGDETTELVPVDLTGSTSLGYRKFDMPDRAGGWMFSAPESHNAFVNDEDKRLGGRLKPLIRLVKAWKYYRSVPVSSFYLEMRTVQYAQGEQSIIYPIDLPRVLIAILEERLQPILDPRFKKEGHFISATNTEAQRVAALTQLKAATQRAASALEHHNAGRTGAAFMQLQTLYNGAFPNFSFR